jgi:hypothetical protein
MIIPPSTVLHQRYLPGRWTHDPSTTDFGSPSDVSMRSRSSHIADMSSGDGGPPPPFPSEPNETVREMRVSLYSVERRLDQIHETVTTLAQNPNGPAGVVNSVSSEQAGGHTPRTKYFSLNLTNVSYGLICAFLLLCILNKLPKATITLVIC